MAIKQEAEPMKTMVTVTQSETILSSINDKNNYNNENHNNNN